MKKNIGQQSRPQGSNSVAKWPITIVMIRFDMLEVIYRSSTVVYLFVLIVQISSLATDSIAQTLLTFWSQAEQSWMFALIVAALSITYIILQLYCQCVRWIIWKIFKLWVMFIMLILEFACTLRLMAYFVTVIV